jgi:hypothetical protein
MSNDRENAGIARKLKVKAAWLGWGDIDFRRLASQFTPGSDAWLFKLATAIVGRLPKFVPKSRTSSDTLNVLADDRDKSIAKSVDLYLTEPGIAENRRTMAWAVKEVCKAYPMLSGKTVRNAHKRFGRIAPP